MAEIPPKVGTLYIAHEVLQYEKWIADQAIHAAKLLMNKYKWLDGFLKPSPVRQGDFSLILADFKLQPVIASFIGIPGRGKSPIIEELFVAS